MFSGRCRIELRGQRQAAARGLLSRSGSRQQRTTPVALGAALTAWHHITINHATLTVSATACRGAIWARSFRLNRSKPFYAASCAYEKLSDAQWAARIAELLSKGCIVAVFKGRMEFGPRALGNRSILADARAFDAPARINKRIKFRESFRPFAPAVLEEFSAEYFQLTQPSPYMLFTADVVPQHRTPNAPDDPTAPLQERLARIRSDIPGVTHLDYSARVQTVSKGRSPRFHALLRAFYELTGCPVLINTSLNVRGEPIVCRPEEAYRCFMKTGIDHLVLDCYLVSKSSV